MATVVVAELEPIGMVEEELSAEELAAREEEEARKAAQKRQDILDRLAQFVNSDYNSKKSAKEEKKVQMLCSLSLYNDPLTDPYLESIEEQVFQAPPPKYTGTGIRRERKKPYPNIVRSRCKNVISQLIAGQFATGDDNWDMRPSPAVDDYSMNPQATKEELIARCRRMKAEISDQLNDCDYKKEYCRAIEDFVILGTGILKGPNNSSKYRKTYVPTPAEDGTIVYMTQIVPIPRPGVWRVQPWFFFPDWTTNDPSKLESAQEIHPYTKTEMEALLKHQGFILDQLQQAYELGPSKEESDVFDFLAVSEIGHGTPTNKYIVKEYHGPVDLKCLLDLEIVGEQDQLGDTVMAEVWECNGKTIRVALPVLDAELKPPYAVAAYEPDPGYVMGYSLPLLTESQQRIVRTLTELTLDNVSISALPQFVVDTNQITPAGVGNDYSLKPGKGWKKTEFWQDAGKAIEFFFPPDNSEKLVNLINVAMGWAEIDSGVSEMIGGLQSPQAVETQGATGVAIANQNALTPLLYKQEILIDNLTQPVIRWMYDWNMQYNPREDIKGDYEVDVRTPIKTINAAKEKVELERLSAETAQNPELAAYIKMDGLTQTRLAGMHIPNKELILRTEEEAEAWKQQQQQNQGPDPNMLKAQAELMNAETRREEIGLEMARLQFEQQQGQRREEMEYQEKMANAQIRMREVEGHVLAAQLERETEWLRLAQQADIERAKIILDMQKSDSDRQVELFLAGQENAIKAKELQQTDEELALKRQGKTGV